MKKLFCLTLLVISLASCKKDYNLTITGVDFHGIDDYDNNSKETEFLNSVLLFEANFTLDPPFATNTFKGVGDITIINPLVENEILLTSNHDMFLTGDTLITGENLIHYFEFKKIRNDFHLSYNFKSNAAFLNETGYYTFYFTAALSDHSSVIDSCLVKINF